MNNQYNQPGAMQSQRPKPQSALDALRTVEHTEIAKYCRSMSIGGELAQTVSVELGQGQTMWASKGSLLAYDSNLQWSLKIPGGAGKAIGRMMSGESASLAFIECKTASSKLVLSANQAGKLVTWDLSNGPIVCTSGAFVAAMGNVDISVTVARSAGAALFGGGGLFMQRLSGTGIVFLHGAGDFIERQLAPGEKMLVSTGNLAVFSGDVNYNIRGVGGCFKSLFGGEGLFMTEMTGPGWVMLQSLKKLPGPQVPK
jgi:uncharacterized protein (AIM24 family)